MLPIKKHGRGYFGGIIKTYLRVLPARREAGVVQVWRDVHPHPASQWHTPHLLDACSEFSNVSIVSAPAIILRQRHTKSLVLIVGPITYLPALHTLYFLMLTSPMQHVR